MSNTQLSTEQLVARLEQLERRYNRLQLVLAAVLLVAIGCGAAGTTAQYRKVTAHNVSIFGAGENGEVITLDRTEQGGRLVLRDAAGKVRVEIDSGGLRTRDAEGAEQWSSTGR
jgi:hypothetical protein